MLFQILQVTINSAKPKMEAKNIYTSEDSYTSDGKIKNGLFYGIGTGVEYKNFLVDLSYDITQAKTDEDDKFNIKKLTLSLGYQFNF